MVVIFGVSYFNLFARKELVNNIPFLSKNKVMTVVELLTELIELQLRNDNFLNVVEVKRISSSNQFILFHFSP